MHFEVLEDILVSGGVWDEGGGSWSEIMVEWELIGSLARDPLGSGRGSR